MSIVVQHHSPGDAAQQALNGYQQGYNFSHHNKLKDQESQRQDAELQIGQEYLKLAQDRVTGANAEVQRRLGQEDADKQFTGDAMQAQSDLDPEDQMVVEAFHKALPNMSPEGASAAAQTITHGIEVKRSRKGALNFATKLRDGIAQGHYGQDQASAQQLTLVSQQLEAAANSGLDPKQLDMAVQTAMKGASEVQQHQADLATQMGERQRLFDAAMTDLAAVPTGELKDPRIGNAAKEANNLMYGLTDPKDFPAKYEAAKNGWVPYMTEAKKIDYGPPALVERMQRMEQQLMDMRMMTEEAQLQRAKQGPQPAAMGEGQIRSRALGVATSETKNMMSERFGDDLTPERVKQFEEYIRSGKSFDEAVDATANGAESKLSGDKPLTPELKAALDAAAAKGATPEQLAKIIADWKQ